MTLAHKVPEILHAVQDAGYTEPTPIQTARHPAAPRRHDLIGIAQTGTGKTARLRCPFSPSSPPRTSQAAAAARGCW